MRVIITWDGNIIIISKGIQQKEPNYGNIRRGIGFLNLFLLQERAK